MMVGPTPPHSYHGFKPWFPLISAPTNKTMCWVVTRSYEWMVRALSRTELPRAGLASKPPTTTIIYDAVSPESYERLEAIPQVA